MTRPVEWVNVARLALSQQLKGRELADELERLADDQPRSLFDQPVTRRHLESAPASRTGRKAETPAT